MNFLRNKILVIILIYAFGLGYVCDNLYAGGCYSLFGASKELSFLNRLSVLLRIQDNLLIIKGFEVEDFDEILSTKSEYERLKVYVASLRRVFKTFNSRLQLKDIFDSSNEKFKNLVREFGVSENDLMLDFIYPPSKSVVLIEGIDSYLGLSTEERILSFLYDIEYGLNGKEFLIDTSIYDKLIMCKGLGGTNLDKYNQIIEILKELLNSEIFQEGAEQLSNNESLYSFYNSRIFIQISHIVVKLCVLLNLDHNQSLKLRVIIRKMFVTINQRFHDYFCSGVVVSSNTLITAGHCLAENNASVLSYYKSGEKITAQFAYRHKSLDLGIVRFPDGTFGDIKPVKINLNKVNLQDRLLAIGTSGKEKYKHIGFLKANRIKNGSIQNIFSIGALRYQLKDGDSGGALFDLNGDLVGIAVGTKVFKRIRKITVEGKTIKIALASISDYFSEVCDSDFFNEAILVDPKIKINGFNN